MENYITKNGLLSDLPIIKKDNTFRKKLIINKNESYTLEDSVLYLSNTLLTNLLNGNWSADEYNSYRKILIKLGNKKFKFLQTKNDKIDITLIKTYNLIDMYYDEILDIINSNDDSRYKDLTPKAKNVYSAKKHEEIYVENPLYLIKGFNSHIMSILNGLLPIKKDEDLNKALYINYHLKQDNYYDSDPYIYIVDTLCKDISSNEFYNNEFHINLLETFIKKHLRGYLTYSLECFITKTNQKIARERDLCDINYYNDRKIAREKLEHRKIKHRKPR